MSLRENPEDRQSSSTARAAAEPLRDPLLLRRLLRAKDRMDAASHEAWSIERLAAVSGVSDAHFARSFKRMSDKV